MGKETCEASGCTRLEVSSRFEAREQPGGPSHDYGRQWRWMGELCCVDAIDGRDVRTSSWRKSTSVRIGLANQIFVHDKTGGYFRRSLYLSYLPYSKTKVPNLSSLLKFDDSR